MTDSPAVAASLPPSGASHCGASASPFGRTSAIVPVSMSSFTAGQMLATSVRAEASDTATPPSA